jgi:creatinine amidohydrolase/Fe(II)-dependent formamide hydrolase-like protein
MPPEFSKCLRFSEMDDAQWSQLRPRQTLFLFPVGGIEDHGPHLPLDLDLREAVGLCEELAKTMEHELKGWTCVLMPPLGLAVQLNTTKGAFRVRAHVLRDALVDLCRGLANRGFVYGACFSGTATPRQLTVIEEAGKLLNFPLQPKVVRPRFKLFSLSSSWWSARDVFRSPFWPDELEHGGARDTSVALALGARVSESYKHLPRREPASTWIGRAWLRWTGRRDSYWGSPADASLERGRQELKRLTQLSWSRLKPVLETDAPVRSRFRTWYSLLPPNWGFFHGWILVISFFLCLGLWLRLTL